MIEQFRSRAPEIFQPMKQQSKHFAPRSLGNDRLANSINISSPDGTQEIIWPVKVMFVAQNFVS
ncbi:MAG: hypothetical protein AUJ04_03925 [Acidobacteria bacterium 13_1_40CM_3_55_6]|nr:MAG: hypothetical protein AUJ04_03925 [Acidobacteria bacterium 13_1_40CM_3_55_6]